MLKRKTFVIGSSKPKFSTVKVLSHQHKFIWHLIVISNHLNVTTVLYRLFRNDGFVTQTKSLVASVNMLWFLENNMCSLVGNVVSRCPLFCCTAIQQFTFSRYFLPYSLCLLCFDVCNYCILSIWLVTKALLVGW